MTLTTGTKSMLYLGALCIALYVFRLAFRAFIYGDMYLAPGEPYGIADVIELLLFYLSAALLSLSAFTALVLCVRGLPQTKKAAAALIGLICVLFFSYSPMHQLAATL